MCSSPLIEEFMMWLEAIELKYKVQALHWSGFLRGTGQDNDHVLEELYYILVCMV